MPVSRFSLIKYVSSILQPILSHLASSTTTRGILTIFQLFIFFHSFQPLQSWFHAFTSHLSVSPILQSILSHSVPSIHHKSHPIQFFHFELRPICFCCCLLTFQATPPQPFYSFRQIPALSFPYLEALFPFGMTNRKKPKTIKDESRKRIQHRGLKQDTSCPKRTILSIRSPTMHNHMSETDWERKGLSWSEEKGAVQIMLIGLQHVCSADLVPSLVVRCELV